MRTAAEPEGALSRVDPSQTIVVVMGGGRGSRLYPLTRDRAKPAVSFGGKYRLIDITLTNCLRSRFERIFILTQFNSFSLNRHIWQTYSRETRGDGFIEVMAAEQTPENRDWFQGTADAVRQSLRHVLAHEPQHVLILSADQIYSMDYRELLLWHQSRKADCTIAAKYSAPEETARLGVVHLGPDLRVRGFHEKPSSPDLVAHCRLDALGGLRLPEEKIITNDTNARMPRIPTPSPALHSCDSTIRAIRDVPACAFPPGKPFLCSMGIYLFDTPVLLESLQGDDEDFGKQVIPWTAQHKLLTCYPFDGYWEDVGTIEAFYRANMDWREGRGIATAFQEGISIITHSRQLPPSRLGRTAVVDSVIADGCDVQASSVCRSIIGVRSRIGEGSVIEDSILMGNDRPRGVLPFEIGARCTIRKAIVDKNVVIGDGSTIANVHGVAEADGENYAIRSGIVVIPRRVTLPPGTVI